MISLNRQDLNNTNRSVAFGTNLDKSISKKIIDVYKYHKEAVPECLINKTAQLKNDGFDKLCLTIEKDRVKGDPRKIYDILKAFHPKNPSAKIHLFHVTGGEPRKLEEKFLKLDAGEIQANLDKMIQQRKDKSAASALNNEEKQNSFTRFVNLFK
jgi:hypothetical protein